MVQGVIIKNGFIENVNPATGEIIRKVQVSTKADVDAAVAAAKAAQLKWAMVPLSERAELVRLAVKHLGENKDELAKLITQEMGKTLRESMEEVLDNCDKDEYCQLVMEANEPEVDGGSVIVRHPHGVVSICAPWNYPLEEIVLLAIPSLIAGNAVVIKPSEVVPLSSGEAAKAFQKGLNGKFPGLVNLLQGDGEVGSYMVSHPDVDMCAFTGSTATGAKILKAASDALKPVVLECGGKDPMVVMADADLDKAAQDAVDFSLANAGQVCCAVERVYVAASVAEEFEQKVVAHAKTYKAGNGLDEASTIGPLVSELQRTTVHQHVEAAKKAGARCMLGGEMPPKGSKGTFYPPTVLCGVPHQAAEITQQETFGPVVAVSTFDGDDETAVSLANDSTYGLTASVYSGDLSRAGQIAARLAAGQVGINNNPLSGARSILCPFVGHKRSGYGTHSGKDGWRQFSTPKSLVYTAPPPADKLPTLAQPLPGKSEPFAAATAASLVAAALAGAALAVAAVTVARK